MGRFYNQHKPCKRKQTTKLPRISTARKKAAFRVRVTPFAKTGIPCTKVGACTETGGPVISLHPVTRSLVLPPVDKTTQTAMAGGGESEQPGDLTSTAARPTFDPHLGNGELLPPVSSQLIPTPTRQDKATSPPLTWATWGRGENTHWTLRELSLLPPVTPNPKERPFSCPCPSPTPSLSSTKDFSHNKLKSKSENSTTTRHQQESDVTQTTRGDHSLPKEAATDVTSAGGDVKENLTKNESAEEAKSSACHSSKDLAAVTLKSPGRLYKSCQNLEGVTLLASQNGGKQTAQPFQDVPVNGSASNTRERKRSLVAPRPKTATSGRVSGDAVSRHSSLSMREGRDNTLHIGPIQNKQFTVSSKTTTLTQKPTVKKSMITSFDVLIRAANAFVESPDAPSIAVCKEAVEKDLPQKLLQSIKEEGSSVSSASSISDKTLRGGKIQSGVNVKAICSRLEKFSDSACPELSSLSLQVTSTESRCQDSSNHTTVASAVTCSSSKLDLTSQLQILTSATARAGVDVDEPQTKPSAEDSSDSSKAESGKLLTAGRPVGARFPFRPGHRQHLMKRQRHVNVVRKLPVPDKDHCCCAAHHAELAARHAYEAKYHDGCFTDLHTRKAREINEGTSSEVCYPDKLRPFQTRTDTSRSDSVVIDGPGHAHLHHVVSGRPKTRQGTVASSWESWVPPLSRHKNFRFLSDKEKAVGEHHVTDKPPEGHNNGSQAHPMRDGCGVGKGDRKGVRKSPDTPWGNYRTPRPIPEKDEAYSQAASKRCPVHHAIPASPHSDVTSHNGTPGEQLANGTSVDGDFIVGEGHAKGDRRGDGDGGKAGDKASDRAISQRRFPPRDRETIELTRRLTKLGIPCLSVSSVHLFEDEDGELITAGKGTYATVFVGRLENRSRHVAVKHFEADTGMADILEEARVMSILQDTGFVPELLGVTLGGRRSTDTALVQDYYANGVTLHKVIYSKSYNFSVIDWLKIIFQLARGLQAIHERGVLLNDLKADNVLVDSRHRPIAVKFIDFGIASYRERFRFTCDPSELARYSHLAPEVRRGGETSAQSDVYSLGHMIQAIVRERRLSEQAPVASHVTSMCLMERSEDRSSLSSILALLRTSLFDQIVTSGLPKHR